MALETKEEIYFRNQGLIYVLFLFLLNMAGVPPILRFYVKALIILESLRWGELVCPVALLAGSGVFVFIYLRICLYKLIGIAGARPGIINSSFVTIR